MLYCNISNSIVLTYHWSTCGPGPSRRTTGRQRFFYAKKNREAIFFGVDRAAVRRRPPVDVRPGWQAQQTPSWLAQQTPSWLAQQTGIYELREYKKNKSICE